jgi:hypothetical protein
MRDVEAISSAALGLALLLMGVMLLRLLRGPLLIAGLGIGGTMAVAGLYMLVRASWPYLRRLARDPYSLDALREVEESSENEPLETEKPHGVYCPTCDEVYPEHYRICPRCGRKL